MMDFRVVCLILAAASALTGAELTFSHKLHLGKVGLDCVACHGSVNSSQAATDDNVSAAETCLACHNGETAPQVDATPLQEHAAAERSFQFNHEFHLAMGNVAPIIAGAIDSGAYLGVVPEIREQLNTDNACLACHRGIDQAETVDGKAHLPIMSDCLVCHTEIDNPFTCEKCHAADVQIKPADHTPEFIDRHSTGKMGFNKLTCQPCHGRKFRCMGCH